MITAERRHQADKKAAARWERYHASMAKDSFYTERGFKGPETGKYRKVKGCECRVCSSWKQIEKHRTNKQIRREPIVVS